MTALPPAAEPLKLSYILLVWSDPHRTACLGDAPPTQITAVGEYAPLCTFLETILTMIWYPTSVATLSRRARDVVEASFARTSDGGVGSPLVQSKLHDFGFRGCTGVEQSIIGGCAHLLSFTGSDTMSAAFYAQVGGAGRVEEVIHLGEMG